MKWVQTWARLVVPSRPASSPSAARAAIGSGLGLPILACDDKRMLRRWKHGADVADVGRDDWAAPWP